MNAIQEEARLRRLARRQGLRVCKSRARNPDDPCAGRFHIVDHRNVVVDGAGQREFELDLEGLARALDRRTPPAG